MRTGEDNGKKYMKMEDALGGHLVNTKVSFLKLRRRTTKVCSL